MEFYQKVPSGCAIAGIMNTEAMSFSGNKIMDCIEVMHDRSNGLGGGFASYGIYPDLKDCYAFHLIYDDEPSRVETEQFLRKYFVMVGGETIPTRNTAKIRTSPMLWRYFLKPMEHLVEEIDEEEFVVRRVMEINTGIKGAFVSSSGKNMGVFKGVGYPEDIGEFFMLEEYHGYLWTAHGRFPTNTSAWWGGAHPFSLLDWSVVHNGEISSYGTNARYLDTQGYPCTLETDTEVITYAVDLLMRKHSLSLKDMASVLAAPFWDKIDNMEPSVKEHLTKLRIIYKDLLLNGPFGVIIANTDMMIGLTDRIKLRPLIAAQKDNWYYISTEEAAIRKIEPKPEEYTYSHAGKPLYATLKNKDKKGDKGTKISQGARLKGELNDDNK
ncbi:Glutamate synthase [NADPH] large chain [Natranaerofaba carboxydovora]|nr:glutamine amidotransferase family protein [Natranaerofaba carboxydovora]UMZ73821.1 Glutamate synthase [NADPH] large chain [Natranaerofaba carboxydovora]